jgi:hypothetical protein
MRAGGSVQSLCRQESMRGTESLQTEKEPLRSAKSLRRCATLNPFSRKDF